MSLKNALYVCTAASSLLAIANTSAIAADARGLMATGMPGIWAVPAPPPMLDYVHASDAALAQYAVPPRPNRFTHPAAYLTWKRLMLRHWTRIMPTLTPGGFHGPMRQRGPVSSTGGSSTPGATPINQSNWSGFAIRNGLTSYSKTSSFQSVQAEFWAPSASPVNCNGLEALSVWVGIDGFQTSPDVLQAGAEANVQCNKAQVSYAWIEWYPNSEGILNNFPVQPGDEMGFEVWNTSTTTGYAYFADARTNLSGQLALTAPAGTKLIGNSTEWITEAVTVAGQISTEPCYKTVTFEQATAADFSNNMYDPGEPNNVYNISTVQNGKQTSGATLQSSTSFYTYYD
jgi:hypothetical protein